MLSLLTEKPTYSLSDKAPEKGGSGILEWPPSRLSPGSFPGLRDFKDALRAAKPHFTTKGNCPKRLSQGLNKTLQAEWMELSCGHPPSSDITGITIFSGKYVNHEMSLTWTTSL